MSQKTVKRFELRRVVEAEQSSVGFNQLRMRLTLNCGHVVYRIKHRPGALAQCHDCGEKHKDLLYEPT